MAPKITFCSTPESIGLAVSALSSQQVILVDCEAQELGMPTGVLSIISLSDVHAKRVFLIDALAFPSAQPQGASRKKKGKATSSTPRPHPALAPLLALLSRDHITKVFWDGRADALELSLTYGLVLSNVLDLQLVDVVARTRNCPAGLPAPDMQKYFKPIRDLVDCDPGRYADIFALRGLGMAVSWYKLVPKGHGDEALKDSAVVAMHESGGSSQWLARPLPPSLLKYAAHDLTLIALVYAHFQRRAWVRKSIPTLRTQSAAYICALETREENARLGELGLKRFMPLGIIDKHTDADRGAVYACSCCGQELTVYYYTTRSLAPDFRERLSFCRLCSAVALRNKWTSQGEWIELD
ncbi:ribonuclease H-like domain-containing protein [Lenzites betulinus]|nr:ribonuclease H-like domain-containing protein [Lenzites betulinus]